MQITSSLIAVCTKNRKNMLKRCIEGISREVENASNPQEFRILIVDNSLSGIMHDLVKLWQSELNRTIFYVHEPIPGLSSARNAALKARNPGESVIFIDDDEWPQSGWLQELLRVASKNPRDIIGGKVTAMLPEGSINYPMTLHFHDNSKPISWGFGNIFLPAVLLDTGVLRFDMRYNHSGGEDTDFCITAKKMGYKISLANTAVCYEEWDLRRVNRKAICLNEFNKSRVMTDILVKHKLRRTRVIIVSSIKILVGVVFGISGFLKRNSKVSKYEIVFIQGVGAIYGFSRKLPLLY